MAQVQDLNNIVVDIEDYTYAIRSCYYEICKDSYLSPEEVNETKPDYVFMLLWNIKDEIVRQLGDVKSWATSFICQFLNWRLFHDI